MTTFANKEHAALCSKLITWAPFADSSLSAEDRFFKLTHHASKLIRIMSLLSSTTDFSDLPSNYLLYMPSNLFGHAQKMQNAISYYQQYYGTNYAITADTTLSKSKKDWFNELVSLNMIVSMQASRPMQFQQMHLLQQQQQDDGAQKEDNDKDEDEEEELAFYSLQAYVQELKKWLLGEPTIMVRTSTY